MKYRLLNFLAVLFCAFILQGCSNFLTGGNLVKELEQAIEIANAKEHNVEINLRNNSCGTITPSGVSKIKKGVSFSIELSIKSGYAFDGVFNLYKKEGGKTTKLKNPEDLMHFVEKSRYNAGFGNWYYIYEATLLTDDYDSILINPEITNPNSTEPPKILDVSIDYRYGNEKKIRDYFDVHLFVECETVPNNIVRTSFIDSYGDFIDGEWLGCIYEADIEDMGNGNFRMSATVDLRDIWLTDDEEYKLILYVENDGNITSSFEYEEPFMRQAYSSTNLEVYNSENTHFDLNVYGTYSNSVSDGFDRSEENLSTFSENLKLVITDIDNEGLGLNLEGAPVKLSYGFCQEEDELDTLELNYTISEYSVYDFETEFKELEPEFNEATNEYHEWSILKNHLDEYPDFQYNNVLDVVNHINENLTEYEYPHEFNFDVSTFDFDLRANHSLSFFLERHKVYDILDKHQNKALDNKSIVNLSLPNNLDKTKDVYIKISSENGINNQKYVVFVIPAPPLLIGIEKTGETSDSANINLYARNRYAQNQIFIYNDESQSWYRSSTPYISNLAKNRDFYVSSVNTQEYYLEDYTPVMRSFNLYAMEVKKYSVDLINNETLRKFPQDAPIAICLKESELDIKNTGKHTISINLDRNIYNQFEIVFIKYENIQERIELPEDNVFSFDVKTENFYSAEGRKDFSFTILGSKNGVTYETVYTIDASDDRIIDNVSPSILISGYFDLQTEQMIWTNIAVDSTGNFITIMGTPTDIGNNLPDMVPVYITCVSEDSTYRDNIELKGDATKYLNIPISHLENGKYMMDLRLEDKMGNEGSLLGIEFIIDRESVFDNVKIIKNDQNKFSIDAKETNTEKYSLSYFDKTEKSWKPITIAGDVNASVPEVYEKSGFFQLNLYNQDEKNKLNNYFKYPYLFYFPEEKVNERDFQVWKNSIRIIADKPVFIHFLTSDIDWGKNLEDWENHQSYSYSVNDNEIYADYYNSLEGPSYSELKTKASVFEGNEVEACVADGDYTASPYICSIPWDKLNKKYAAAVIIWADNKKDLILLDTSI